MPNESRHPGSEYGIRSSHVPSLVISAVLIISACLCLLCGKVLLDARKAAWERAAEVAESLLAAISSDIERNIESLSLSMLAVMDGVTNPRVREVSPEIRQLVLFDRSATARHLDALAMLDVQGIVRFDSRTLAPEPVSRAERDYFHFHRHNVSPDLYVSRPIIARSTGNNLVAISRRLSGPDGSFAGVVIASLRLAYFRELFGNVLRDGRDRITIRRNDGTILMRWPTSTSVGEVIDDPELIAHVARRRSGQFTAVSPRDGVERLVVYRQISDLPLVVDLARPVDAIYAEWRQYAIMVGSLIAMLCMASLALIIYVIYEWRRRAEAFADLAVRATTDALTGLFNRHHFDGALRWEWWRAVRESSPIALLMIDADHFKRFNDQNGHQAGDATLRCVGDALKANARAGTDLAARYGGDEFAILLPGHTAEQARRVADGVRVSFAQRCADQGIEGLGLSSGLISPV